MTQTQRRALKALGQAAIHRSRRSYDWLADGDRFPLVVIAALRKRGFARVVKLSDRLQASITEAGRIALREVG